MFIIVDNHLHMVIVCLCKRSNLNEAQKGQTAGQKYKIPNSVI